MATKTLHEHHAMVILRKDHDLVKKLFDEFDEEEDAGKRKEIADHALRELKVHTAVEEELFYPALRRSMEDDEGLLDEADEEHHAAKVLIAELELMSGREENYRAKFDVLAESVRHHIKEEQGPLFRQGTMTDIDFDVLGERMLERKRQLEERGVPSDAETEMVKKAGLRGTSPSRKAEKSIDVPVGHARRQAARAERERRGSL